MFENIKDILVPKYCIYCLIPNAYICKKCFNRLDRVLPTCPICNRLSNNYTIHIKCISGDNTKPTIAIHKITSIYTYNRISKKIMKEIKYRNRTKVLDYLIELSERNITQVLKEESDLNSYLIIPIPLHRKRYLERGFNQSELIADKVSAITGFKVNKQLVRRSKNNRKQSEIKVKNKILREKNTQDIFEIDNIIKESITTDTQLLLVDDVITTKSTIQSLSKLLKQEGFKKIQAFSLFRANAYEFLGNQSKMINMHSIQT